jgi:MoaA/NifB/PqqE/SkfB family radical SAM enzyme
MKANGPCIFYIDTNNAIQIVYKWLCENYPEFAGDIGIFSGLVDNDNKVLEKNKRLILTTMKSGSTGEHIDHLKMAFVVAAPFKSTVTAIQCAGRLRDANTYFIELVDLSFQTLKRFYYYKLPTYNERMLTVQDVNFSNYKLEEKASDLEYEMMVRNCKVPIKPIDPRFGVMINPIRQYEEGELINPIKQF